MKHKIKVGDHIYRIWPSGHKTPGIACHIESSKDIVYNKSDEKLIWTGWWALESHENLCSKDDGYGLGDYKYEHMTLRDSIFN